jgi:hypothetical protein
METLEEAIAAVKDINSEDLEELKRTMNAVVEDAIPNQKRKFTDAPTGEKVSRAEYMRRYRARVKEVEEAQKFDKQMESLKKNNLTPDDAFRMLIYKKAMEEDNPKWAELWERLSRDDRKKDIEYSLTADDLFRIRREAQERIRTVPVGTN